MSFIGGELSAESGERKQDKAENRTEKDELGFSLIFPGALEYQLYHRVIVTLRQGHLHFVFLC